MTTKTKEPRWEPKFYQHAMLSLAYSQENLYEIIEKNTATI